MTAFDAHDFADTNRLDGKQASAVNWTRLHCRLWRNIREWVHLPCYSRACAHSERKFARDRKMVAGLTRKIGDSAAWRNGLQSTAADEVEPKWKKPASRENELTHDSWCARPIL